MKTSAGRVGAFLALTCLLVSTPRLHSQGTAYTYQGRLQDGTKHASGTYDFTFAVWTAATGRAQVGNTVTKPAIGVTPYLYLRRLTIPEVAATEALGLQPEMTVQYPPHDS